MADDSISTLEQPNRSVMGTYQYLARWVLRYDIDENHTSVQPFIPNLVIRNVLLDGLFQRIRFAST